MMFDPQISRQEVETQRVLRQGDLIEQATAELDPLRRTNRTLEDRFLHALTVIQTGPSHAPQSPFPNCVCRADVVCNEHLHRSYSMRRRWLSSSARTAHRSADPHADTGP